MAHANPHSTWTKIIATTVDAYLYSKTFPNTKLIMLMPVRQIIRTTGTEPIDIHGGDDTTRFDVCHVFG